MIVFGDLNYRMRGEPSEILHRVVESVRMHRSPCKHCQQHEDKSKQPFHNSKYFAAFHSIKKKVGLWRDPEKDAVGMSRSRSRSSHCTMEHEMEEGESERCRCGCEPGGGERGSPCCDAHPQYETKKSKPLWAWVKDYDQLAEQMAQGLIFSGFTEETLCFCPTFRRVPDTNYEVLGSYEAARKVYTTSLGKGAGDVRTPSYCDRILMHSLPTLKSRLKVTAYDCCEYLRHSDHVPICASMTLKVERSSTQRPDHPQLGPQGSDFGDKLSYLDPKNDQHLARFSSLTSFSGFSYTATESVDVRLPTVEDGEENEEGATPKKPHANYLEPISTGDSESTESQNRVRFSWLKRVPKAVSNGPSQYTSNGFVKIKLKLCAFTFNLCRSSDAVMQLSSASLEAQMSLPYYEPPNPRPTKLDEDEEPERYQTLSNTTSYSKSVLPPQLNGRMSDSKSVTLPSRSRLALRGSSSVGSEDWLSYLDCDKETKVSGLDVICPLPCEEMVDESRSQSADSPAPPLAEIDRPESSQRSCRLRMFSMKPHDSSSSATFTVLSRRDCYSLHAALRFLDDEEFEVGQGVFSIWDVFHGNFRAGRRKFKKLSVPLSVGGLYRGQVRFDLTAECYSVMKEKSTTR